MRVSGQATLLAHDAERLGVGRIEAIHNRVLVAHVIRYDHMTGEVQERGVSPKGWMVLLVEVEDAVWRGCRIGRAAKVPDVGDALLLVADQVVQYVDVFRLALLQETPRRVEVNAGVVHVEVIVAIP